MNILMKKLFRKIFVFAIMFVLCGTLIPTVAKADAPPAGGIVRPMSVDSIITIYIGEYPCDVDSNVYVGYGYTVTGREVKILQYALTAVDGQNDDVSCHPGTPDGEFGPNTYNALYSFQVFANTFYQTYLPSEYFYSAPDGICGPVTWSRLSFICN